ncbi:hypothetical protein B0H13DRAFT_1917178 [Mycena leptocephala]|nr:hypothetical protein B0H13DRAFT_1917178 [Mycena leptocephala]
MNTQPNYNQYCTEDPPGSREGSGDLVHPSRMCLPAASLQSEISRSLGEQGPSPDYQMRDPFCSDSVALVVATTSEGQQIRAVPSISTSESSAALVAATMRLDNRKF